MPVYAFENHRPIIAATTYLAPSAQIIGRVTIGERCYIGHGTIGARVTLSHGVKNHQKVPPGKVAVGVPVRIVGDIDERHPMMTHTAKTLHVDLARRYAEGAMVEIAPPCPGTRSNRDA